MKHLQLMLDATRQMEDDPDKSRAIREVWYSINDTLDLL